MPSSKIQYTSLDPQILGGVAQEETSQEIKSSINTVNTNASTAATKATSAATDAASVKTTVGTINTNLNTANTNINSIKSTVENIKTSVASRGSVKSIQSGFLKTRNNVTLPTTQNISYTSSSTERVAYEQITIGSVNKDKCIVNIYTRRNYSGNGIDGPLFGVVTGSTSLAVYTGITTTSSSVTAGLIGYRWEVIEYY